MSDTLRSGLIRLAFHNPDLRADLLPLLTKEAAGPSYKDYVEKKRKKGEKPLDEEAWESRVKGKGEGKSEEKGDEGKKDEGGGKSVSLSRAEGEKLSEALGGWHSSASDPIYAVSSHAGVGKPIPADAAKKALGKVTTMLEHADAYQLSDSDKKQLSSAKKMLEKAVGSKSEKPKSEEKGDEGKKDEGGAGGEVKLSPRLSDSLSRAVSSQREHSWELRKVWGLSAGGKPIPADTAKKALGQINALLKSKKLSDEDKKALSGAVYLLEQGAKDPKKDWAQSGGSKSEKPKSEKPKSEKPKASFKKNYRPKMESVMTKHDLTDDDAKQVIEFSVDRPKKGKPQSPEELKRRFMQNAKPETKERMKNMSPADFMIMLRAVLDQEEGGGKTASLRSGLIRLAYENPNMRADILPLLADNADR